ncbi:recombinase [Pandoraea capi]|uniref:Recombinase n=1 Tax=Pandoraea capi TaxID=2508286 RepID=A0ABY6VUT3_9BURK|nr:type II toxin-antitoxin system VapC family toxin [Pandoraea capi]VVD89956.1 recombinase [Pandoraea capi]
MYLLDTNIVSEYRKSGGADVGVQRFMRQVSDSGSQRYLSVLTLGELRRGACKLRYRNDVHQAALMENWIESVKHNFDGRILDIDQIVADVWGRMRVPHQEHPVDKLIAATALVYQLIVVTRNVKDFSGTGVEVYNPFAQ